MSTIKGWFTQSQATELVVVRAPLLLHSQHFIPRFRSSARCPGSDSCILCEISRPIQTLGVIVVSRHGQDLAHLLRLTTSQSQLVQSFQTMGPNLQGLELMVESQGGRILGAKTMGRTVCSLVPATNYVAAIGRQLYDRILRDHIRDLNCLFEPKEA